MFDFVAIVGEHGACCAAKRANLRARNLPLSASFRAERSGAQGGSYVGARFVSGDGERYPREENIDSFGGNMFNDNLRLQRGPTSADDNDLT